MTCVIVIAASIVIVSIAKKGFGGLTEDILGGVTK